jgi:hypothetical protein
MGTSAASLAPEEAITGVAGKFALLLRFGAEEAD